MLNSNEIGAIIKNNTKFKIGDTVHVVSLTSHWKPHCEMCEIRGIVVSVSGTGCNILYEVSPVRGGDDYTASEVSIIKVKPISEKVVPDSMV